MSRIGQTSVLIALFAVPLGALAAPLFVTPRLDVELAPRLAVSRVVETLDRIFVPRGVVDQVVRTQRGLRDLMHGANTRLAALADHMGLQVPDLSVLTTDPIRNGESSGFGWRNDPFRHRAKFHSGTDFRGKHGTPVLAAGDGVVVFAGRYHGYGNMIDVDHGGGVLTRYAHLRRLGAAVNEVVIAGEQIGEVGSSGRATGPHLHFEVRLDRRPVDPITAMTVAEITRESAVAGQVAAFALAPELQYYSTSQFDPKHAF